MQRITASQNISPQDTEILNRLINENMSNEQIALASSVLETFAKATIISEAQNIEIEEAEIEKGMFYFYEKRAMEEQRRREEIEKRTSYFYENLNRAKKRREEGKKAPAGTISTTDIPIRKTRRILNIDLLGKAQAPITDVTVEPLPVKPIPKEVSSVVPDSERPGTPRRHRKEMKRQLFPDDIVIEQRQFLRRPTITPTFVEIDDEVQQYVPESRIMQREETPPLPTEISQYSPRSEAIQRGEEGMQKRNHEVLEQGRQGIYVSRVEESPLNRYQTPAQQLKQSPTKQGIRVIREGESPLPSIYK